MKHKTHKRKYKKQFGGNKNIKYILISGPDNNRKIHMIEQFDKYGIDKNNVMYIEGYNKDKLSDELINLVCLNKAMKKGAISCAIKHYLALRYIVENNINLAVIMEDDIIFKNNVPNTLNKYLRQLPSDWDILFESDYLKYDETPITNEKLVYKKNNETGGSRGMIFYLINLKTAQKLYNCFLPFNNVVDFYYNDLFKKYNINSYWSEPSNVEFKKDIPSLIQSNTTI